MVLTLSIHNKLKTSRPDSSSWSSPPLLLLRDINSKLLTEYDGQEVCAPSQSQDNVGVRARLSSQDGVPQKEETAPLSLPQLNRLFESSFPWDESSGSNTGVVVIPSQFKVTQEIHRYWEPFRDLQLKFVGSHRLEKLDSRSQQRVVGSTRLEFRETTFVRVLGATQYFQSDGF